MISFFDKLDQEKIIKAIESDLKLNPSDLSDIKACVWILGKTYGEKDFEELEILDVERKFEDPLCAGTADILARIKNPKRLPKESKDSLIIIDWKTSGKQDLDTKWKYYYVYSWQWKIYSCFLKADYFEYRGISKSSGDTKEILIKVPEENRKLVEYYLQDINLMREQLTDNGPWPRHMPSACNQFGRECQYWNRCSKNDIYYGLPEIEPFHYTNSETFMLCPERYRMDTLLSQEVGEYFNGSEDTRFGSAVHRGMQEIYSQIKALQNV